MRINTSSGEISIKEYYHEQRTVAGEQMQTLKIMLEGSITSDQLAGITSGSINITEKDGVPAEALTGYTNVHEHYLVIAKPSISQTEAEDMRKALEQMGIIKRGTWTDGVYESMSTIETITGNTKGEDIS